MLLICGTVPAADVKPIMGPAVLDKDELVVRDRRIPCGQGTAAMLSAACVTTTYLGVEQPYALIAGDTGDGRGSRQLYKYLIDNVAQIAPDVLCLHYLLPIVTMMKTLHSALDKCPTRPLLLADAGSMYAVKAAGLAPEFDVFTPDPSELGFLADPKATHPAYIAEYLFASSCDDAQSCIESAYENNNAAKVLVVKGRKDYIARDGRIEAVVDEPNVPAMEAIGGTGDAITGLVAAFLHAELEPVEAGILATRANRTAGLYADAGFGTSIPRIIGEFERVFSEHLCAWSGVCTL